MKILNPRKQRTSALAFDQADNKLAVAGSARARPGRKTGRIDIWDLRDDPSYISLPTQSEAAIKLAFAADQTLIAVFRQRVMLFAGANHRQPQSAIEWTDGKYRVITPCAGTSRLLIQTVDQLQWVDLQPSFTQLWCQPTLLTFLDSLGTVAFSPDGRYVAVPGRRWVEIRDLADGKVVAILEGLMHEQYFLGNYLLWTDDGRWIGEFSCGNFTAWTSIWDSVTGRHVFHMEWPSQERVIGSLYDAPSGRIAILSTGCLRILEPPDWATKELTLYSLCEISAVARGFTGSVAIASKDGTAISHSFW